MYIGIVFEFAFFHFATSKLGGVLGGGVGLDGGAGGIGGALLLRLSLDI